MGGQTDLQAAANALAPYAAAGIGQQFLGRGLDLLPVLQREGELVLMNPGSICFPRGEWAASYGRYEDGVMSIHACRDGTTLMELVL